MKGIQVGSRVRIAGEAMLAEWLHREAALRPEPDQMCWAGRETSVRAYRRGPADRAWYALDSAPGLWLEEWLERIQGAPPAQ